LELVPFRELTIQSTTKHRLSLSATTTSDQDDDDDEPSPQSFDHNNNDWFFDTRAQRCAFYTSLATLETIVWYWWAPGIDPDSRWFNFSEDGKLLASLLDPATVFAPPQGSVLGFSSPLLNRFLMLPSVWSLMLLQEQDDDAIETTWSYLRNVILPRCVCAASFFVGGGILIPYMIFRRPRPSRTDIDPHRFPGLLELFENRDSNETTSNSSQQKAPIGPLLLLPLTLIILFSFVYPFVSHHSDWGVEWQAFLNRVQTSQFTTLSLFDSTMISVTILDPMADDALRRGYMDFGEDNDAANRSSYRIAILQKLAPFVAIPILGPVAWIYLRPRYALQQKNSSET